MIDHRVVWGLLVGAQAVVNAPFVIALLSKRNTPVTTSPAAQAIVDSLTTAASNLPGALANASTAVGAQAVEDLAAIKTAADGLSAAIDAALPAPVVEPAPDPSAEQPQ